MTDLTARAEAAGLCVEWEDADGRQQRVSDAVLEAILACLRTNGDAAPFVTADVGRPIALPAHLAGLTGELDLEDGTRRSVAIGGDGALPPIAEPGYHRLLAGGETWTIAVAPLRCPAVPGEALWATAMQLPSLRGDTPGAFGDFGTLAQAMRAFGEAGAAAVAISPTHALFPADATRYSPYAPSSRLYRNVLFAPAGAAVPLGGDDLIDWSAAIPDRLRDLRIDYDRRSQEDRAAVAAFRTPERHAHATFDALHSYFHQRDRATGWRDWPEAFHDAGGPAVARFVADHADAIDFYLYLQWRAETALAAAGEAGRAAGMPIGLIADLAIGVSGDGSDGWSRRDELLTGLSIGAPPDPLGPDGQNWGITALCPFALRRTGFAPFIATLRSAFAHAGGLRIDHALGLKRLWVIPEGESADKGAYLQMPFEDLLRILKIEAHRAGAIVIGEDLGTVPPGFRDTMAEAGLLGMRVLPFERDEDGGFVPPAEWDREAVAMTGTHDIATVAGWWLGRDIAWRARIADRSPEPDMALRVDDRTALWRACAGDAPEPTDPQLVVDAAIARVAATPCPVALIPVEDLLGLEEQPNLPGTIDEHPNWRRRLPDTTPALLARPAVAARIHTLNHRTPA
ncbi:4-alpha-glucanotransferase [Sphingomonas sp. NY01]|uniref:4-alpha-glucanotransferase n=1 Tax=Sphingomonas sp. NY01 TaxID=2968057 RepID=UPI00315D39B4